MPVPASAPPPGVTIRPETRDDHVQIRALLRAAFQGEEESVFVDLLREAPGYRPDLAFVAASGRQVVGHVMLTELPPPTPPGQPTPPPDPEGRLFSLAPLAVHPDRHRQGIGRALVHHALTHADQVNAPVVVLEGDPAYYRRLGFVDARRYGLLAPSPTIPDGAFQAYRLAAEATPRGRVGYPASFWAAGSGLPESPGAGDASIPWLYHYARHAGWIEAITKDLAPETPIPHCPDWTVADLLAHVATVHRTVVAWIRDNRRPSAIAVPTDHPHTWYAAGWRELYTLMASVPPTAPAATWCPWDNTIGFWRRRMAHEVAIHTVDALAAATAGGPEWTVPDELALDGIDEVLRLFVGIRARAAGDLGDHMIAIRAGDRSWTIGLHGSRSLEIHELPNPPKPDAVVSGDPASLYRWLWGRSGPKVRIAMTGDPLAIADLRRVLTRATR